MMKSMDNVSFCVQRLETVMFARIQSLAIRVKTNIIYQLIKKSAIVVLLLNKSYKIIKGCENTINNCVVCENQSVCKECAAGFYWDETEIKCLGKKSFRFIT